MRIGVLSFQSPADTLAQWVPTAQALQRAMPQTRFDVVPLSYEALDAAVAARQLDFVLTNPEHYVVLRNQHMLRPMATINQNIAGRVVDNFGSVIFTLMGSDIQTLAQVHGKRVAAVGLNSLGGYLMAADVFLAQSLQLENSKDAQVSFLGVPHSRVVQAVLAGQADVGIVRTGVLEQMAAAGKLDLHQLRVLNEQPSERFPQLLSTDLYAEWPWAAMPSTAPELTREVLLGLLQISADSDAARAGRYQGFSIPANYTPVEELMRRLHVYPGQDAFPTLQTLWLRYEHWIEIGLSLVSLFWTALLIYFWRSNRRLKELTRLNRESQTSLELTAAAFNSQVGLIVTDELTRIQRANPAMAFILGFDESDLLGQSTEVLRGASVSPGTLRTLWEEVKTHGRWQGELLCQHRDGHDVPCMVSISTIRNPVTGLTGFVGSFADITAQKKSADDIKQLAYFDTLTGLPNRRMFLERLQTTLDTALAEGTLAGLMFIDLDHFKNLNDAHGHSVGDQLLKRMSQRLGLLLDANDLAARLGGDEFVVMMAGLSTNEDEAMASLMALAERIHHTLLEPFELDTHNEVGLYAQTLHYTCSGSIGVALFGLLDEPLTEVLKRADVAMYKSKQDGRNLIRQYDPQAQKALHARMALSNDLNLALRDGQLTLLYQLQVDAHNQAVGAECLMRWHHPVRGAVSPVEFIPLAEESGAIVAMGDWVVRSACETLARWARVPQLRHLTLSVNVSPRQFTEHDFVARVTHILQDTGAAAHLLRLEVTEGIVMQNTHEVIEKMRELCALGLSFSIDDFGTGYSSLSYIQTLPLAELKIDKAFVNDLTTSERAQAIVKAIIAIGHSMGITLVSEGVETQAQKDQLLALGCTLLQGYLVSRPIECSALEQLIATKHSTALL
ncbi:EAL domain-containing protein [Rhodoferax sp.]|uniref:EAL domain-containing protein n=1 Tax=Rhodoferax sp. TaxID=50421 RepID=UPI00261E1E7A|nr:EAL domain-containing protein [Rhodoferax sp.]MDD5479584.1 EAL domain-containing protein [Rhodoferax sp.]